VTKDAKSRNGTEMPMIAAMATLRRFRLTQVPKRNASASAYPVKTRRDPPQSFDGRAASV
jgi:hypothetical protein